MSCRVCMKDREGIKLFKTYICRECFYEIGAINVLDDEYNDYINLIKILLYYYITGSNQLNPVN